MYGFLCTFCCSAQLFVSGAEASPQGLLGAYGKQAEVSLGIPVLWAYHGGLVCSLAQLKAAQQSSCVKMQQLCEVPSLPYSAWLSDKALPFICTGKEAASGKRRGSFVLRRHSRHVHQHSSFLQHLRTSKNIRNDFQRYSRVYFFQIPRIISLPAPSHQTGSDVKTKQFYGLWRDLALGFHKSTSTFRKLAALCNPIKRKCDH